MFKELSKLRPEKVLDENIIKGKELYKKGMVSVSKTDLNGTILYVNDVFTETSGYSKAELITEHHNIIRHPDMPRIIFKFLWKALSKEQNFHAVLKNLAKDGRYYWVVTDYTINRDESGNPKGYTSRRRLAPKSVVEKIKPLYEIVSELENTKGIDVAENYFKSYMFEEQEGEDFESIEEAYNNFVIDLFEDGLKEDVVKSRRRKINKTLEWFFNSEYDENAGVSTRMSLF